MSISTLSYHIKYEKQILFSLCLVSICKYFPICLLFHKIKMTLFQFPKNDLQKIAIFFSN